MLRISSIIGAVAIAAALSAHKPALAADYPSGPVKVVVGFSAGSTIDLVARVISEQLQAKLGQPFIVENRVGAGGAIAARAVASAKPDGQTLLIGSTSFLIADLISKEVTLDFINELTPVAMTITGSIVVGVHPSVPARTLSEFATYAKANPGKLKFGSLGPGIISLATHNFMKRTGIEMIEVPYKGSPEISLALKKGDIQFSMDAPLAVKPESEQGDIVPLATAGKKRSSMFPNVPTTAEAGFQGYEVGSWHSFMAPVGTPDSIVVQLSGAIAEILKMPRVIDFIVKTTGYDPADMTTEQFRQHLKDERAYWTRVAAEAGIKPQ